MKQGKLFTPGSTVLLRIPDGANFWDWIAEEWVVGQSADTALACTEYPRSGELSWYEGDFTAPAGGVFRVEIYTVADGVIASGDTTPDLIGLATAAAQATAQNDLDILTGTDGVTLATSQALYTPATAALLTTVAGYLDTEIAAILADTSELQANQGNWLTATGFSTHSATDVKTALEASGSDLDLLVRALVNKLLITEADGAAELFTDAGVSAGTVATCFSSIAGVTQRKALRP